MEYLYIQTRDEQLLERELKRVESLGISKENIYIDIQDENGFNHTNYKELKTKLREGDLLWLNELESLGASYSEIKDEWKDISREINADVVVFQFEELLSSKFYKDNYNSPVSETIGKVLEENILSAIAYYVDFKRKQGFL